MDVRIGIRNVTREVVLESDQSPDEVQKLVDAAIADGTPLRLQDERGQRVTVPAEALAYVEIGAETKGRVGFGG